MPSILSNEPQVQLLITTKALNRFQLVETDYTLIIQLSVPDALVIATSLASPQSLCF